MTTEEIFARKDNAQLRNALVKYVTKSKTPGNLQMVPLTVEGVGYVDKNQISIIIRHLTRQLPIERPRMIHGSYNCMNSKGANKKDRK